MDKETLSNYGWIVICVMVLAVMLALATPFGNFIAGAIKSTTAGFFSVNQNALNSTGLINIGDQSFGEDGNGGQGGAGNEGGTGNQGGTGLPTVGTSAEDCTWDEIKAISDAGKGDEYFNLGDTKTFTTTDGKEIVMEIVAFNADTKADGTGTAGITWISQTPVAGHQMNSTSTNIVGWEASGMRVWLQGDFYATLPSDVKDNIVTVKKMYGVLNGGSYVTKECVDNVWIPSAGEIYGNNYDSQGCEDSGVEYTGYFASDAARAKTYNGNEVMLWLRSGWSLMDTGFRVVSRNGSIYYYSPAANACVVLGFCT